ncbi:MAG: TetR family transcriptional regulator [Rhodobacteraceae bacterium]|nr:TetR family transcriptional regulator [Paracoccaceae bacterium]
MSKHKARQQARIVSAAMEVIQNEGLSRVNMSKLAEAAGMTRQTLYNHFPDVESIITATLQMHGEAMQKHLAETTDAAEGAIAKLLAFAAFHIEAAAFGHENISLEAGLSAKGRAHVADYERAAFSLLESFVLDGVSESGDAVIITHLVQGVINGGVTATTQNPAQKAEILRALEKAILAILS